MSYDLDGLYYTDITIRFEPGLPVINLGNISCTVFDIQGRNRKVSIVFPTTSIPQHIMLDTCEHWINAVQGPMVSGCGIDEDQRELLLHLCIAYRAFVRGHSGINHDDWFRFASNLVIMVCETSRRERVDGHIGPLVDWLHAALPAAVFLDTDPPAITYNDDPPPLHLQHIILAPEGISRADQATLRQHLEGDISALVLKTLRNAPEGATPNDFPTRLLDYAREEDARRAAGILPLPAPAALGASADGDSSDDDTGPIVGHPKSPLYLTVGLPAFLIGSIHTPLVEILSQCTFHRVARDGSTQNLHNPLLAIPTMAGPLPPTPPTPPADVAPSTPPVFLAAHTMESPATPTNTAAVTAVNVASPPSPSELLLLNALGISPQATSSPARESAPGASRSSRNSRSAPGPRRRRSTADIEAMNARQRAVNEVRRKRAQEARDARAAARAARRTAARATDDGVGDSDDSMPSLRTVTDSSDDFISDFELAYPDDE